MFLNIHVSCKNESVRKKEKLYGKMAVALVKMKSEDKTVQFSSSELLKICVDK
jgi:hypothetical protein